MFAFDQIFGFGRRKSLRCFEEVMYLQFFEIFGINTISDNFSYKMKGKKITKKRKWKYYADEDKKSFQKDGAN